MGRSMGCCGVLQRAGFGALHGAVQGAGCGAAAWLQGTAEGCLGWERAVQGDGAGCYGAVTLRRAMGQCRAQAAVFGAEEIPCTWQLLKTASLSCAPGAAPSRQASVCRPSSGGSGEMGRSPQQRGWQGFTALLSSACSWCQAVSCPWGARCKAQGTSSHVRLDLQLPSCLCPGFLLRAAFLRLVPVLSSPASAQRAAVGWADAPAPMGGDGGLISLPASGTAQGSGCCRHGASVPVVSIWGAWHPSGAWGVLPRRASCHLLTRQAWALLRMRRFDARAGGLCTATSCFGQDRDTNGRE